MQLPDHGANPNTLFQRLGLALPKEVVDLSENVNALGQPAGAKKVWETLFSHIGSYPHMEGEPLRSELAAYLSIDQTYITLTNGAAEALMTIAQFVRGRKAVLLEPSFSEYKRTLLAQDIAVQSVVVDDICTYAVPFEKLCEQLTDNSVLYICNPNNPTGVCQTFETMRQLVHLTREKGALLVVDEAFIDFTDEASSVVHLVADNPHLIVLRSMTKMYGLAGVRLGYIVSQQTPTIAKLLPHWSVSYVALELGRFCLKQQEFVKESRRYSDTTRKKMRSFLQDRQCIVTESAVNFLTFKPPFDVKPFYRYLLKHGIVTRHTENFVGLDGKWLRIGMKEHEKLQLFMERWRQYENDLLHSPRGNRVE